MNDVLKSIGWAHYTVNPVKGACPMKCSYCYALRFYQRKANDVFKDPTIRWDEDTWQNFKKDLSKKKEPCRIFVGSTIELFGDWVKPEWLKTIFDTVREYPQHTFIFLTKQPHNLIKWSPFPDNAWVGVSAINNFTWLGDMSSIKASVKFISFEPLLKWGDYPAQKEQLWDIFANKLGINWVIVGRQTPPNKKTTPEVKWIKEIVDACDKVNIPIFLKDNLKSLLPEELPFYTVYDEDNMDSARLRQEFPLVKGGK